MIKSISEYESFVKGLKNRYREIKVSKLVFKNQGPTIGELVGEIEFDKNIQLNIYKRE